MEAPVSASQGPMRSLPRKLESLLSRPKHELRAEEKKKLRVLQADLQGLIDNYLIEPSEVVSPALTAHSWMKDVRDLSYDIDDFIYELAHVGGGGARISVVQKPPRFKICRFPERLKRSRRWVTDEISRFRTRVEEAIRLHKECLRNFKWRPRSSGQPPPSPCGRLVGVDSSIQKLYGWLANDGQPEHRVVSIVGTAGVGKTTLAREVFRRLRGQFQCLAFVRTSPKADMKGLLTSVLSQVRQRCHLPDDVLDVHKLIVNINTHLQHKTYLIVIEDLWALSTWDLVNRALPKGNWCTRILTTTETEVIAQTCCADNFKFIPAKKKDNSKFIIKKEPLSEDESRELFSNRAFGKQADCPQDLKEISNEIVKISGGLPLGIHILASLLAHHPASNIEQWNYVRNSLSSDLTTYGSLEKINQALIIGYDDLPHDLKACMLYLCLYEEDCVIWKDDLVKQWIAEGFISAVRGGDEEQVAHSYFGELVNRGLIQPVDTNCSDEILSCSVHHMVLHFIRSKSMEDNFCIAVDHSQITIRLADNVRRLGLHLGNVEDATPPGPESMRLSKVRSVAFSGFHKCMPSVVEFRFLQVLNLKLSVDPGRMMSHSLTGFDDLSGNLGEPGITSVPDGLSYNLAEISELFLLRYFHLDACHMSVALPTKMQQLKYLVAWEIDAEVTALPSDIVDLPALLYLRIPSEARLPTGIGRMTCLRTLGVFDLSMNSTEDVMSLGELTSLQDLHLTCSTLQPDNLERNLECLGLAIRKLSNLKCVTLVPADSSRVNTQDDAGASSMSTSWNGFNTVPLPPALLQKLELSRRCCLFSSLPEWTKELTKLCILKIAVREVSQEDVIILRGLPSLTALSLFIWTAPARRIIFDNEGFSVLKYFKFLCAAPCLQFLDAAMPNVRKLKLGFNANRMHRIAGLKRLIGLNEISIKIGDTGAVERQKESTQSVLTDVIGMDPSTPVINVQWVDWNFCGDDEKHTQPQEEIRDQTSEHQNVTAGGNSDLFIEKEAKPWRSALIEAHIQVESSDEQAIQENKLEEDVKKQPDTRSNAAPESTFHLQNTAGGGSREENMRDPFNAPVDLIDTDRRVGNELTRTSVTLSARDYALQNGDAKPFVPGSDTLARQGASLHDDLIAEDPNARFTDPETKELYFRSRTQEDEILLLRKKIADASSKELQLLSEKHILERKLADLRMAVDERQEDAISGALKQLNEKRNHIEENMRLSNDLKVQEEELYLFTSSLLGMLAEYNVRPPQIYASTITTVTKRLYQQMQWKIRSLNDSLGDTTQPGDIYNPNHQQATPSRNEPSSSYNMEPNRNTFPHYAQDSNDRHAEQMYRSTFNQDIVSATPSNYFQENAGPREARLDDDSQFYRNDNQEYSADGDPLPGIEGFQIIGEPRPGSNLTACGFPTNGTTLCNFQWVRCLEDGTRQSIEGATMYDYVVTADDVGTLLAVDCTPMDDNGRQGDLVRKFANDENKISCDPDMQNDINICISRGRADFDVYVLLMNGNSPEEWQLATLVLKRTGYQINLSNKDEVFIDEKYSPNLEAKIPNGRTTQFVLVSSGGVNLPFNTQGITEPNSEDNDVRLRDLIVLVMRTFQNKALDAKRKGKA